MLSSTLKQRDGTQSHIQFDKYPDQCPICHRHVDVTGLIGTVNGERVQFVCRCSAAECDEFFVATYARDFRTGEFRLKYTAPWTAKPVKFADTIEKISPTFTEVYNQAMVAESRKLGQLVGIGLRKALEFLVKDFAIQQHPDKAEEVRKVTLGTCIENYVVDSNIKECASRAAWLGNDETHYVRKWEDKDVEDLKLLVRLTTNWIDNVLMTQRYMAEMQKK